MLTGVQDVIEMVVMEGIDGETVVGVSGPDVGEARSANVTGASCNDVSTTLKIAPGTVIMLIEVVELCHPVHVSVVMFELEVD